MSVMGLDIRVLSALASILFSTGEGKVLLQLSVMVAHRVSRGTLGP